MNVVPLCFFGFGYIHAFWASGYNVLLTFYYARVFAFSIYVQNIPKILLNLLKNFKTCFRVLERVLVFFELGQKK